MWRGLLKTFRPTAYDVVPGNCQLPSRRVYKAMSFYDVWTIGFRQGACQAPFIAVVLSPAFAYARYTRTGTPALPRAGGRSYRQQDGK